MPSGRILLSSGVFPLPGNGLRALLSRCGRDLNKRTSLQSQGGRGGGEGRGAFGFVIGGLVYPLEIVYVERVTRATVEIVSIGIASA